MLHDDGQVIGSARLPPIPPLPHRGIAERPRTGVSVGPLRLGQYVPLDQGRYFFLVDVKLNASHASTPTFAMPCHSPGGCRAFRVTSLALLHTVLLGGAHVVPLPRDAQYYVVPDIATESSLAAGVAAIVNDYAIRPADVLGPVDN